MQYRFDYDKHRNCFDKKKDIGSILVCGDPEYIRDPWFTYVIPAYKRADLLKETLDSVLTQEPIDKDWDIIVVDNETEEGNPTEQLIRHINDPRILYYRNIENLGVAGNYNRCIELARGKWIGMLHADDLIMSDHLRLVSGYIEKVCKKKRELAYIGMRYEDFQRRENLSLKREDQPPTIKCYYGRLKRFRRIDALMTGYSVSLPSFGTVMNRKLMLKEGGFDEELGLCEDVIIPYRMMDRYAVYVTPGIMGFHRNENNESIKLNTIFEICETMSDFREYIYDQNFISRFWSRFARAPHFNSLVEYCVFLSCYGNKRLHKKDFSYIYPSIKPGDEENSFFNLIINLYCFITGAVTMEKAMDFEIKKLVPYIKRKTDKDIFIYGAGKVGSYVEKKLKRLYSINVKGFIVTKIEDNSRLLNNKPVYTPQEIKKLSKCPYVIIGSALADNVEDMETELGKYGISDKANVYDGFRIKYNEEEYSSDNNDMTK